MKTVVTGGAGFIGSHLVDRLLSDGREVVVLDNFTTGTRRNLDEALDTYGSRLEVVEADITAESARQVVIDARPDVILHLAAQMDVRRSVREPVYDCNANVVGTVNMLEAAQQAGVQKFVFTSSGGCIYGPPDARPIDETFPTKPHSPYGASKLCAETYLETWRRLYGLDFTTLALGNVYGPRQDPRGEAGVVAIFAGAMLAGLPTTIFGDGTTSRDYVFVDDVVNALVLAMQGGRPRRYNIGTGLATDVSSLHSLIARRTGVADEPTFSPPRAAELHAITLDASAASVDLGWRPAVDLETGLDLTVQAIAVAKDRQAAG